jgi:hypothetical protein
MIWNPLLVPGDCDNTCYPCGATPDCCDLQVRVDVDGGVAGTLAPGTLFQNNAFFFPMCSRANSVVYDANGKSSCIAVQDVPTGQWADMIFFTWFGTSLEIWIQSITYDPTVAAANCGLPGLGNVMNSRYEIWTVPECPYPVADPTPNSGTLDFRPFCSCNSLNEKFGDNIGSPAARSALSANLDGVTVAISFV